MENKPRFLNLAIDQSLKSLSVGLIGIGLGLQGASKSLRTPFLTQYLDEGNKDKTGFYLGILQKKKSKKKKRERKNKKEKEEENLVMKHEIQNGLKVEALKEASKIEIFQERAASYIRVLKSPVYLCLLAAFVLHISSVLGPIAFKSKYIVAQFGLPLWKANLIISAVTVATVAIGAFFGGYITKKFKLSPRMFIVVILILHAGQIFFHGGVIFVGCDQPRIIGSNMPHSIAINMTEDCHCDPKDYFPVCGSDGRNFHSPCYAGCKEVVRNGREAYTIFFRIIIAFIPAPIVFGKMIDTSCILWNSDSSRKGSCSLYNIAELRIGMFGTVLVYKAAALVFMLLALWKVWSIKDWEELRKKKTDHLKIDGDAETAVSAEHK
ncbi:SLCO3A [Mytilus coruscus]|uniref:SLCO3A n=1 Tax=Mytilus coruscus TaxID=42192 RepID=A0A6J8E3C4_MYTCO|nr:SLCO3A [Mytilus coruscus]